MIIPARARRIAPWIVCLWLWPHAASAADPTAEAVRAAAGGDGGLCVHVGSTDGALEADLAASGRMLVHGLALDPAAVAAARGRILGGGAYGVATVEGAASFEQLPYAENLVNVLVADLDALGAKAPPEKEILRVLVPDGVALLHKGGSWARSVKPRPAGMDVWTHSQGSAGNNPVSKDKLVGPVTTIRWLDGHAGTGVGMAQLGLPAADARTLIHDDQWSANPGGKRMRFNSLICRDPYNGLPRWRQGIEGATSGMVVADDIVLSTHAVRDEKGDFLRGYDARTGKLVRVYDKGGSLKDVSAAKSPAMGLAVSKDTIYQAAGKTLYALDLRTGERRWTYTRDDLDSFFSPSLTPDGTKLCVAEHKGRGSGWRWPSVYLGAITALDAKTGAVVWRNADMAGLTTAYMPVTDKRLLFYTIWGIGSMTEGVPKPERHKLPRDFGVIDVANGKVLWKKGPKDDEGAADFGVNSALIWGDEVRLMTSVNQVAYELETGRLLRKIAPEVVNQRCTRVKATEDYLLSGFGTFLRKDGTYVDQNIARSACATGMTPANGTIFQTRNGCGCFAMIRAFAGYAAEPLAPPVPDARRLEKTGGTTTTGGDIRPKAAVVDIEVKDRDGKVVGSIRQPVATAAPVRDAWINNENMPFPETRPVASGGRELVSVVCENRLECREGGKLAWAFVADGRIVHEPVVHQGRVYVGARDGQVYCLDEKTGALQWRFLAAFNRRRIVAYGGLESAWPINGLALHGGMVCASAGRHPELDGGIFIWGLDPATGQPKWRGNVRNDTAAAWLKLGEKRAGHRHLNWLTNGRLVSDGGKLRLHGADGMAHGGGNKKPERNEPLEIDPADPPR